MLGLHSPACSASILHKPACLSDFACIAGWVLVDAACMAYSMTSVPLYDTLGPEAVTYICGHAELTVVACSIDVLDTLLTALPQCPTVKVVVCSSVMHLPTAPNAESCCRSDSPVIQPSTRHMQCLTQHSLCIVHQLCGTVMACQSIESSLWQATPGICSHSTSLAGNGGAAARSQDMFACTCHPAQLPAVSMHDVLPCM